MKNNVISFINKFCIIFTFTIITYSLFDVFTKEGENFQQIVLECIGLSLIFSLVITMLDYLGNKIKILSSNHFIWIQYIILVSTITFWANIFKWGDWSNKLYIIIFLGVFTLIYLFIYFFIGLSNKEEDLIINEKLKRYQKNM
jgi:hypothetical protein